MIVRRLFDTKTPWFNSKRNITHDMSGHGLVTNVPHEVSIVRGDPGILGNEWFDINIVSEQRSASFD